MEPQRGDMSPHLINPSGSYIRALLIHFKKDMKCGAPVGFMRLGLGCDQGMASRRKTLTFS
jgi:hypothetical protein